MGMGEKGKSTGVQLLRRFYHENLVNVTGVDMKLEENSANLSIPGKILVSRQTQRRPVEFKGDDDEETGNGDEDEEDGNYYHGHWDCYKFFEYENQKFICMTEDYLKVIFHEELESLCPHDEPTERNKLDVEEEVKDCPLCTEAWKCLEKFLQFFDGTNLKKM